MALNKVDDHVLQAVIFVESFDAKFGPLTFSQPKILMPLVNRPLLAYTLDMLARSNIMETFIFCNQDVLLIKNFLKEYQQETSNKMNIQVFVSEEYTNMGAAIRDLDAKGLIKSNFVLINGDCVGNLQLNELIEIHKQNTKNDPGCVMTSVFRKVYPNHRIRSKDNEVILLLDSKKKIVFFENFQNDKSVEIPMKIFEDNTVNVHYDVIDTHISICSDKVPPDFSDNFDFESREDFVNGLLADDELLQHYIYAHILEDGYASRVTNVSTYDAISRDIIQRFAFPIVPDLENDCSYRRYNVYLHDKVTIMNKAEISQNVAIGRNTTIGIESTITDSVIGCNCKIRNNVNIKDSYIWHNVVIEDNCSIEKSIIASDVVIRKGATIKEGCIISKGVIIDTGHYLKPFSVLINDSDTTKNEKAVGKNGEGNYYEQDNMDYDKGEDNDDVDDAASSVSTSFSDSSEESDAESAVYEEYNSFFTEVYESLQRGIEEKLIAENLILEINSSKHAYNVPMKEVTSLVLKAILKLAQQESGDFFVTLKGYMKYMLPVIKNYVRSVDSQNDCVYAIEEFYLNNEDTLKAVIFMKIIQYLYDQNLLDEELILDWFNKPKSLPDHVVDDQKRLRAQKEIISFVKWLKEAEEESSEEE